MWASFVGLLKTSCSLQAKLGRWAKTMRKDIAARTIERRVMDDGEETIFTSELDCNEIYVTSGPPFG